MDVSNSDLTKNSPVGSIARDRVLKHAGHIHHRNVAEMSPASTNY